MIETDILTAFSTDPSPIFFSLSKNIDYQEAKGFGNLNTPCAINPILSLN